MIVDEEKFVIKAYLKADLARLYSPNLPAGYAMCKLRSWIRRNKELHAHMYEGGEGKGDHSYTRRQVRLILNIWENLETGRQAMNKIICNAPVHIFCRDITYNRKA